MKPGDIRGGCCHLRGREFHAPDRRPLWAFGPTYAPRRLVLNFGKLGRRWFGGPTAPILELLIHEFGHHSAGGNHLSESYHTAITKIGGQVEPVLFDLRVIEPAMAP